MSKYLLDEQPLLIMPKLAAKIGLNEAVFLQQIHYWNEINKKSNNNYKDGNYWTFNSVMGWQEQFPFWSKNTVQRTIKNLESLQLVITGNYNKLKIDRTKWYRIDYNVLQTLERSPFTQIGATNISEWVSHLTKLGLPLPETNPEINSETNKKITIGESSNDIIKHYAIAFKFNKRNEHFNMTTEQLTNYENAIDEIQNQHGLDNDQMMNIVDRHFEQLPDSNSGHLSYFASGDNLQGVLVRYIKEIE